MTTNPTDPRARIAEINATISDLRDPYQIRLLQGERRDLEKSLEAAETEAAKSPREFTLVVPANCHPTLRLGRDGEWEVHLFSTEWPTGCGSAKHPDPQTAINMAEPKMWEQHEQRKREIETASKRAQTQYLGQFAKPARATAPLELDQSAEDLLSELGL